MCKFKKVGGCISHLIIPEKVDHFLTTQCLPTPNCKHDLLPQLAGHLAIRDLLHLTQ